MLQKEAVSKEAYEQVQTDYPQFGSNQNGMNGGMIMPTEIEKYLERTK